MPIAMPVGLSSPPALTSHLCLLTPPPSPSPPPALAPATPAHSLAAPAPAPDRGREKGGERERERPDRGRNPTGGACPGLPVANWWKGGLYAAFTDTDIGMAVMLETLSRSEASTQVSKEA